MKLTASLAALLLGSTAMAQTAPAAEAPKPTWTFALHGFVSMSAAYQQGAFILSEGQQSLGSATGPSPVPDKDSLTFDVRQSRFNFSVKGPQVLAGATPSGVLEIDFMQGFGAGNFGDVSLLNRMRLAYSELNWGNHRLQFGQNNDIIFALAPTSLSHIAFPLGFFTGNIGWRRPGIFGYHTVDLAPDLKVEGAWEVGRSQWADAALAAGGAAVNQPGGIGLGEASGGPALEGRVTVGYAKYLTAFVSAHYQNVDLSGYGSGASPAVGKATIQTVAYNGGLKLTLGLPNDMALTVQGTGFTGKNVGPLIANFSTVKGFNFGPNGEDVNTLGWWAQVGLNLTKEFSLWGFYGAQAIDKTDFVRARYGAGSTYEGATTNVIAMYRDGGYALSAEWIHFENKVANAVDTTTNTILDNRTAQSDQYILSANYFF